MKELAGKVHSRDLQVCDLGDMTGRPRADAVSSCDGSTRLMQSRGVRGLHAHPQVRDPGDLEEALDRREELCGGAPAALRNRRRGDLPGVVQHAVLAVDLRAMQLNVSVPGMMCSSSS